MFLYIYIYMYIYIYIYVYIAPQWGDCEYDHNTVSRVCVVTWLMADSLGDGRQVKTTELAWGWGHMSSAEGGRAGETDTGKRVTSCTGLMLSWRCYQRLHGWHQGLNSSSAWVFTRPRSIVTVSFFFTKHQPGGRTLSSMWLGLSLSLSLSLSLFPRRRALL